MPIMNELVLTIARTFNSVIKEKAILDKVLCETVHIYYANMPSLITQASLDGIKDYVHDYIGGGAKDFKKIQELLAKTPYPSYRKFQH